MTRFWITLSQAYDLVFFALVNMVGGEIFIPKLPSMKLVDLFEALAPGAPRQAIGIRSGEKLHESLLTREEARHSMELEKHFVIIPEVNEIFDIKEEFKKYFETGKKLSEEFSYSSDNNSEWLAREDLINLINAN